MSHSIDDLTHEQCQIVDILRTNPDGSGIVRLRCDSTGDVRTTWLRQLSTLEVGNHVLAVLIELPTQRTSPLRRLAVTPPTYVALRVIYPIGVQIW